MVHAVGVAAGDTVVVSGAAGRRRLARRPARPARRARRSSAWPASATTPGCAVHRRHPRDLRRRRRRADPRGAPTARRRASSTPSAAATSTWRSSSASRRERIDTIVDFDAARASASRPRDAAGASAEVLAELAGLIAAGELEMPIADTYPLDEVQAAFTRARAAATPTARSCCARDGIPPAGPLRAARLEADPRDDDVRRARQFRDVGETDVDGARRQIDMALDAGVNLIDTADVYSAGRAEEIVGEALKRPARRRAARHQGALPDGRRAQRRRASRATT